jgi:hypothetical protein
MIFNPVHQMSDGMIAPLDEWIDEQSFRTPLDSLLVYSL